MQRRDFLKLAGLVLAASDGVPTLHAAPRSEPAEVLVVGAGIAGLAAAHALAQQGRSVLVIEARKRIGGRIWTSSRWADVPLDLGASWIHGTQGNPIAALAARLRLRTVATSYENSQVYDTAGKPLSAALERRQDRLTSQVQAAIAVAQDRDPDQSVQQVVRVALGWETLSASDRQLVAFILNGMFEHEYAGSVSELSAQWFDSADAFAGDDLLFPRGYAAIVEHLARDIPIRLNEVVRQIEYDSGGVRVITARTSYTAARIIVTLPLGLLKAGSVSFSPPLPADHRRAIAALGMGVLNKCALRFPRAFWPTEFDWLEYLPARPGEWVEWVSLVRPTGQPILFGFNAADFGRAIESWTDTQIVASAMQTLRSIFGPRIPEPTDYQISRWGADPFAYGSYSFHAHGSVPRMRTQLGANVLGRVFFAGEATHQAHFGTVHGAYMSGLQSAREVGLSLR